MGIITAGKEVRKALGGEKKGMSYIIIHKNHFGNGEAENILL